MQVSCINISCVTACRALMFQSKRVGIYCCNPKRENHVIVKTDNAREFQIPIPYGNMAGTMDCAGETKNRNTTQQLFTRKCLSCVWHRLARDQQVKEWSKVHDGYPDLVPSRVSATIAIRSPRWPRSYCPTDCAALPWTPWVTAAPIIFPREPSSHFGNWSSTSNEPWTISS